MNTFAFRTRDTGTVVLLKGPALDAAVRARWGAHAAWQPVSRELGHVVVRGAPVTGLLEPLKRRTS